jgi:hypothetical protein
LLALGIFVQVVREVVLVVRILAVFTGGSSSFGPIFLPPQLNPSCLLIAPVVVLRDIDFNSAR